MTASAPVTNTSPPAIKFCGLTRAQDVRLACALTVDYIGLVFAAGSPRCVDIETARALADVLREQPQPARLVALLRNPAPVDVDAVVAAIQPDVLQFHGAEDERFCSAFAVPYWKALGVEGVDDIQALVERSHPDAEALLLDAHPPGAAGGTGERFDWTRWPDSRRRLVLAGGLTPDTVAEAVRQTRPFAVDVSSGIEQAPGIKNGDRMRRFVEAVRRLSASG